MLVTNILLSSPLNNLPTCTWRGSAPFCKGVCHDREVEITSATSGTGHCESKMRVFRVKALG